MGADAYSPDLWFILKMAASRTVPLAESLLAAGFDVWTPMETVSRRHGRARRRVQSTAPTMPTYVFARVKHLDALFAEAINPSSNHPQFSVFRYLGKIPLISDRELDGLRAGERHRGSSKSRPAYQAGELVRVADGPAAGMSGVVQASRGKYALVCFPGFQVPLKISTFALVPDAVSDARSDPQLAA